MFLRVDKTYDLLVRYIKQETIEPLRGAGRWIAFGLAGSVMVMLSVFFGLLGLLRVLQSTALPFQGGWSWVPYVASVVVCLLFVFVAISRISRDSLHGK